MGLDRDKPAVAERCSFSGEVDGMLRQRGFADVVDGCTDEGPRAHGSQCGVWVCRVPACTDAAEAVAAKRVSTRRYVVAQGMDWRDGIYDAQQGVINKNHPGAANPRNQPTMTTKTTAANPRKETV